MWNDILQQINSLPAAARNILLVLAAVITGLILKGIFTILLRYYAGSQVNYSIFRSIVFRLNKSLTWILPVLIINFVLPLMELTKRQYDVLDKTTGILLILVTAFLLVAVIKVFEDILYHIYDLNKSDNLRERKIRTQLQFIRKILIFIIVILAIGAILISFSSLRRIGTGLLTGVGISGIIVGFAAQKSLGNLLAGLQIAFTQPLRIDDVLVLEGEFGKVEEITLTYVVLNIWDQRRLILPITYFLEKPFQNWTRTSSEILGTVFLYVDYTAPVDKIREEFMRLVEGSELWDKRAALLQVTDATENTVQLRMMISAGNAALAFDLRCYIRENIIAFIQKKYPSALPANRTIISGDIKDLALNNQNNPAKIQ